jgi:succinate dehydrogenase / fumarate reductase membrane anchor subunit
MKLLSTLGAFLGFGSADEGTGHWWTQRLTAVALVPLTLWFVLALLGLNLTDYSAITGWIAAPLNTTLLILLLATLLHHSQLGLQVVVEDYVHAQKLKALTLMAFKLIHIGLGVVGTLAIIFISVGSS